jgi:LacI family transcriptional regulator
MDQMRLERDSGVHLRGVKRPFRSDEQHNAAVSRILEVARPGVELSAPRVSGQCQLTKRIARTRRRTHSLQVIVPGFTPDFCIEVLRGVNEALADTDYSLVISTVVRSPDPELMFHHQLAHQADGALLVGLTSVWSWLAELKVPVVLMDGQHPRAPSVMVDHAAGGAIAVDHLVGLGHRRIALAEYRECSWVSTASSAHQNGYRAALDAAGLSRRADYERFTDCSSEAGAAVLGEWLGLSEPPTAVVAGNDRQALAIVDAARQSGYRVPEDLAVVGYGDIATAHYVGLTTVRVPMREMGRQGVDLMLRALEEPHTPPIHVRLSPELVVRGTCGLSTDGHVD